MTPPKPAVSLAIILFPLRFHLFADVTEWCFEQRRLFLVHAPTEIDDPLTGGSSSNIHPVHPRPKHIDIPQAIRIERQRQPLPGKVAVDIERAALCVAHESHVAILSKSNRLG